MDRLVWGMILKDWAWFFGGLVTFVGLIQGLVEFIKANRIKRAEFLEKLILEFNDSRMFLAKRILDDFQLDTDGDIENTDLDLINKGSKETIDKETLRERIKDLLRNHKIRSVTGKGEQRARQSFDDLLDFFAKLDYYLSLKLISKKELQYFQYYINRCAYKADGAVLQYALHYGYSSIFILLAALKIKPHNTDLLEQYRHLRRQCRSDFLANLLLGNNHSKCRLKIPDTVISNLCVRY